MSVAGGTTNTNVRRLNTPMGTESYYQREMLNQWSTEVQLLLLCGRSSLDAEQIQRVRACVERDLDWERLIYLAGGHGLVSLLHKNLQLACPNEIPQPYREHLSAAAMKISARNLLLATELLGLLDLFEANGISVIPYKGPALAIQAYRNLRLRGFIDLDILIRRKDLDRVRDLIATLGYKPQIEITAAKQRAIFRSECDQVFTRRDGKIILEVHWAITPPFSPSHLTPISSSNAMSEWICLARTCACSRWRICF
ncbi:MAG: hypothetical protein DMF76_21660 [Acidobacteria bacterium]|nr:MAG: hypothetical protein DMF76_21660 [Acidobacteriota bacterium]